MISIITISMDQGQFLRYAVDSVLSQRGTDLEYVIVDAGSTDGSREYLESLLDPRLRLIFEADDGPADGLNKGVRSSTGDVVGYLNADDVYLAGALQAVVEIFDGERDIDVAYGDGWIIDKESLALRHFESTPWGLRRYVRGGVNVLQQSTFFRRSIFDRTPGFNTSNATCWDGELLVDMALAGARFRHVRADWSAFRLHPDGITGSGRLETRYREDQRRFAARVTGRDSRLLDTTLGYAARGAKILRSPRYAMRRLCARPPLAQRITRRQDGYVLQSGHPE